MSWPTAVMRAPLWAVLVSPVGPPGTGGDAQRVVPHQVQVAVGGGAGTVGCGGRNQRRVAGGVGVGREGGGGGGEGDHAAVGRPGGIGVVGGAVGEHTGRVVAAGRAAEGVRAVGGRVQEVQVIVAVAEAVVGGIVGGEGREDQRVAGRRPGGPLHLGETGSVAQGLGVERGLEVAAPQGGDIGGRGRRPALEVGRQRDSVEVIHSRRVGCGNKGKLLIAAAQGGIQFVAGAAGDLDGRAAAILGGGPDVVIADGSDDTVLGRLDAKTM